MDRTFIAQWKIIIDEDLKDARRCLAANAGFSVRFLRARIAENEAILDRLAATITGRSSGRRPES